MSARIEQLPLFHTNGPDTEWQAAESVAEIVASLRKRVLGFLQQAPLGLTDDEGGALLGADRLTFGRRRHELVLAGQVMDSGLRRPTPAGRNAVVWIAVPS